MVVQTFEITPGHTGLMGLDVGAANVREYFPRGLEAIELELDHLCILCALRPSFWEDRPEIHDTRLGIWLEAKRMGGKLTGTRAPLAMIPTGQLIFRLEVITRDAAEYALTASSSQHVAKVLEALPLPLGRSPARRNPDRPDLGIRNPDRLNPEIAPASAPLLVPVIAPVVAFDRRRRSVAHEPERRRIGKLKDNDSSASPASPSSANH